MSARRLVRVFCDIPGCYAALQTVEENIQKARDNAENLTGWKKRRNLKNNHIDVCPLHRDENVDGVVPKTHPTFLKG